MKLRKRITNAIQIFIAGVAVSLYGAIYAFGTWVFTIQPIIAQIRAIRTGS